jgi:hypothetical protein
MHASLQRPGRATASLHRRRPGVAEPTAELSHDEDAVEEEEENKQNLLSAWAKLAPAGEDFNPMWKGIQR